MAPSKKNLSEHYDNDGTLDLSLTSIQEVPVRDIAAIPKAINLDLSCNTIVSLPKSFASSLTHLVKLDLSKNHIGSLPENFGLLVSLKHLDLDNNQLESLPLSFGNLKSLRWLDLKNNPLMPKVAQIAGHCLDAKQCQAAAKNVVAAFKAMQEQVNAEITRRKEEQSRTNVKEENVEYVHKESQKSKKKKKKSANNAANKQNSMQTNGQTHLVEVQTHTEEEEAKTSSNTVVAVKPGIFRKAGRLINSLIKVTVMFTLFVVFSAFLLSLVNEELYLSLKKTSNDLIQAHVPKKYLQHWDQALAVTRRAAESWSAQLVAVSVHWYNRAHEYLTKDEVVQQYLENIKSGWHIVWIKVSEAFTSFTTQLPHYYESFKKVIYESPHKESAHHSS